MLFGRNRTRPVNNVAHDAPVHDVYMIHFVEHDKCVHVNAPSIEHAIQCARMLMHHYTDRPDVCARPLMYDNNRIAIVLYSIDYEYTVNVARMHVYSHDMPDDVVFN